MRICQLIKLSGKGIGSAIEYMLVVICLEALSERIFAEIKKQIPRGKQQEELIDLICDVQRELVQMEMDWFEIDPYEINPDQNSLSSYADRKQWLLQAEEKLRAMEWKPNKRHMKKYTNYYFCEFLSILPESA